MCMMCIYVYVYIYMYVYLRPSDSDSLPWLLVHGLQATDLSAVNQLRDPQTLEHAGEASVDVILPPFCCDTLTLRIPVISECGVFFCSVLHHQSTSRRTDRGGKPICWLRDACRLLPLFTGRHVLCLSCHLYL